MISGTRNLLPLCSLQQLIRVYSWITRLDEVFDSGGLVDVKKEQYSTPNEMHAYQMDLFFQTLEEASIGMDR
jgi:hypothetical protein